MRPTRNSSISGTADAVNPAQARVRQNGLEVAPLSRHGQNRRAKAHGFEDLSGDHAPVLLVALLGDRGDHQRDARSSDGRERLLMDTFP